MPIKPTTGGCVCVCILMNHGVFSVVGKLRKQVVIVPGHVLEREMHLLIFAPNTTPFVSFTRCILGDLLSRKDH